ncbi:MAG: lipocalin family protein [Spirochaetaceae bacterium]|nr:lipocalin family protein [Spirochaetaceae bacterium]
MNATNPREVASKGGRAALAIGLAALAAACSPDEPKPGSTASIPAVEALDLSRFEGAWFELARIPIPVARDWVNTADIYIRNADGSWSVRYEGNKGSPEGPRKTLRQRLRIPDPGRPGEMEVSVIPFLWSKYRLVHMSPDYRFMLVTSSSKRFLWLMSREQRPEPAEYEALVARAAELGFDTARLERVLQRP